MQNANYWHAKIENTIRLISSCTCWPICPTLPNIDSAIMQKKSYDGQTLPQGRHRRPRNLFHGLNPKVPGQIGQQSGRVVRPSPGSRSRQHGDGAGRAEQPAPDIRQSGGVRGHTPGQDAGQRHQVFRSECKSNSIINRCR